GWYQPPNVPEGFFIVWDYSEQQAAKELFPSGEITRSGRRLHYELGPAPIVLRPLSGTRWVTASDVNAHSHDTAADVIVHPPFYLAVSTPELLVQGEQASVAVRALDPDGSAAELERVELTLRHTPSYLDWTGRPAAPQRCRASGVDGMATCRFRLRGVGE